MYTDRDEKFIEDRFYRFYASIITNDLTNRWITQSGPFTYDYRWFSQSNIHEEIKDFVTRHFVQVYGVHPDTVELL